MTGVQVSVTITTDGETRTLDLRDGEGAIECGSRETIPDRPQSFRIFEATDDVSLTVIGKRA